MTIITETLVELADRHTTLYHFAEPPNPAPLPFCNAPEYCALHKTLATTQRTEYSEVHEAGPGSVLARLSPGYRKHKYWSRHLSSKNYDSFPDRAWQNLLPIQGTLTIRIECTVADEYPFRVQPVPRVLLYPFGWSTWVSLRLIGSYEIPTLTSFLESLLTKKAFTIGNDLRRISLAEFFERVAQGVRADAFGENRTNDLESPDTFIVTTVMAKHGGSPALGALNLEDEKEMLRLVRPAGAASGRPFREHVFQFPRDNEFEYLVFDDVGRFNWIEHLLIPRDRNRQLLHCYHHNSFLSLIQADHFLALLASASKQKSLSAKIYDLAQTALSYLESPSFKNASLRAYLEREDVKDSLEKFSGRLAAKSPKQET